MSPQIPHGWNRWRFWTLGQADDYGYVFRSFMFRLKPGGRTLRIDIGVERERRS